VTVIRQFYTEHYQAPDVISGVSPETSTVNITAGAYIRCHDCKHWSNPPDTVEYGHCYRQGQGMAMMARYETERGYGDAMLWTRATFGCTEGSTGERDTPVSRNPRASR